MKKTIDCLIIGHNAMDFAVYESKVREMGTNSGAFRDLNLNFIQYKNEPYTASEIFNLFYYDEAGLESQWLTTGETFSATVAYLGTYLHRKGFSFDYINSFQDDKEELREKLMTCSFQAIAITTTLYVSVFPIIEIIDFIKAYNESAKIIVGGPFIYHQYRQQDPASLTYLFKSMIGADFYVINPQGEAALVEILTCLKNDLSPDGIENIYWNRDEDNDGETMAENQWPVIHRENNVLVENMVNWNLFNQGVGEYVNLRTSISCPYSCAFCCFPQHAGKYQLAGVEKVEQELLTLNTIDTVKSVSFIDDTFNIPAKRFKEILRMMIKNEYKFNWYSHFRCQFADPETLALMKQSGCEGVFLGIESGNNRILKNMRKAAAVEQYLQGIRLLKEYGIMTYGSFIIGFPGETDETVQDTIAFIKESGLDFFRVQLWYCDPMTPIWQDREKYRIKGNSFEWSHADMDSNQAADWVDHVFMTIQDPVWVPQYNFEFDALFHLLHRGLEVDTIKNFLRSFNRGIKDRIKKTAQREISINRIKEIKESLGPKGKPGDSYGQTKNFAQRFDTEFDF